MPPEPTRNITISTIKGQAEIIRSNLGLIGIRPIIITEDSLYRCLNEKIGILDRKNYWKILLPIFVSLGSTNYVVNFSDKYGVEAAIWQQIFWNGFIMISFLLFVSVIYRIFFSYNLRDLIEDIDRNSIFCDEE